MSSPVIWLEALEETEHKAQENIGWASEVSADEAASVNARRAALA